PAAMRVRGGSIGTPLAVPGGGVGATRANPVVMQVIFFGAGASAPACYPLASDLLPAIEKLVKVERRFANLQSASKVWKEYRDKARGPIKAFLTSPNPEVVFSFLDLYDIAQDAEFRARMA